MDDKEDTEIAEAPAVAPPAEPAEEPAEESGGGKRLSQAEWTEIVRIYELGEATISELAAKYGVSRQALSRKFKAKGIQAGSKKAELEKAATEAVKAEVISFERQRMARVENAKEEGFKRGNALAQLNMRIVVDAIKPGGGGLAARKDELKALNMAIANNTMTTEQIFDILDVKAQVDSESLPEIKFRDLTQEEIDAMRQLSDDDLDFSELVKDDDEDAKPDDDEVVVEDS